MQLLGAEVDESLSLGRGAASCVVIAPPPQAIVAALRDITPKAALDGRPLPLFAHLSFLGARFVAFVPAIRTSVTHRRV
jgi:hypothetical protein